MNRAFYLLMCIVLFCNCNNTNVVSVNKNQILKFQNYNDFEESISIEHLALDVNDSVKYLHIDSNSINRILNLHKAISDRRIIHNLLNLDLISGWNSEESLDKKKYLSDIEKNTQFYLLKNIKVNEFYNSAYILSRYLFMDSEINKIYLVNFKLNKIVSIVQISSFISFDDVVISGFSQQIKKKIRYFEEYVNINEYNNDLTKDNLKDTLYYADFYINNFGEISIK